MIAEHITYLTEWASRWGAHLEAAGEVGFGRECVGIGKDTNYISYTDTSIWTPEDAYHKSDCLAVLGRGDDAIAQLYEWVKWLDQRGYTVETVERQLSNALDAAFHGCWISRLVPPTPVVDPDPAAVLQRAADAAPTVLGNSIGDGVAVVLLDHEHDEIPDPNIHELAHRILVLAEQRQAYWPAPVYIRLRDTQVARTECYSPAIGIDRDAAGDIVGIEVLDAADVTIHGIHVSARETGKAERGSDD